MVEGYRNKRVVIFRPAPFDKWLGCIRARNGSNFKEIIWDAVNLENIYMGLLPANCPFEAMLVEIKLVTAEAAGDLGKE
ncbi:hypothetical protein BO82DRAFT_355324 [Aspergillus uvarum CBS 121591]|uniref:Uncharacterized protein n=1 Tax=Aspergillus uvarum CBS 121591 TaxID=1448315 RepID=A0A319C9R8_9EURO|nr:hypothetical protein BO82DRAFT_355324 [Aspergillus uvarum CBS 121591]PYH80611.1 hypothetical protein BO82DRAFT_355324 [Aspergillus uvarum CBS 121591]